MITRIILGDCHSETRWIFPACLDIGCYGDRVIYWMYYNILGGLGIGIGKRKINYCMRKLFSSRKGISIYFEQWLNFLENQLISLNDQIFADANQLISSNSQFTDMSLLWINFKYQIQDFVD